MKELIKFLLNKKLEDIKDREAEELIDGMFWEEGSYERRRFEKEIKRKRNKEIP